MEGDGDLWLSGDEIFLLGTICFLFFCRWGITMREKMRGLVGGGV